MNKKKFIGVAIILILIVFSGLILLKNNPTQNKSADTQAKPETAKNKIISIASIAMSPSCIPLFIAQKKGFLEQHGLTIKFVPLESTTILQALISKEIDYSPIGVIPGIIASQKGVPVKIIFATNDKANIFLGGKPDVKIQNIKKIGINKPFTSMHYQALKFVYENNLPAKISFTNSSASVMSQILNGTIDVGLNQAPTAFLYEDRGLTIIKSLQDDFIEGALIVTEEKIKSNPEEIKKVIAATQEAINFIKNNPEETKELLFDYFNFEKNEINTIAINGTYPILAKDTFTDKGIPKDESIVRTIQFSKIIDTGTYADIEKQTATPEEIAKSFDFQFLK